MRSLAFHPNDALYGWDAAPRGSGMGLVLVNTINGSVTDVNPSLGVSGVNLQGLAIDGSGVLFGAADVLDSIDPFTGEATEIGDGPYRDLRDLEAAGGTGCAFTLSFPLPGLAGAVNRKFSGPLVRD